MDQETLCQQHLPTAQHAAPATVCGPGGALQLRELPPVGQPNPGHESQTEPVHLVWEEVKEREDETRKKLKEHEGGISNWFKQTTICELHVCEIKAKESLM